MNYIPDPDTLRLWDTWVYVSADEAVHLFFLANKPGEPWRWAGHAVSRDWLHWEDLPPVRLAGEGDEWDAGAVGTGMVFRYDDGRYYMTYTGKLDGSEQCHGLLVSDDLVHWEKLSRECPVWRRATMPPYEQDTDAAAPAAWRDAFVTRNPAGHWEAVCAGRVGSGPHAGRGCLGRCRIAGLDRWEDLPPLAAVGHYPVMEVPEVFAFAGRYWVTFSSTSGWGVRLCTPERPVTGGSFYLSADDWEGPYRARPDNLLIGAGQNRMSAYVARSIAYGGQRLVYHHYAGDPPAFGLPKVLAADGDRLYLTPWEGLADLHQGEIPLSGWAPTGNGPAYPGDWDIGDVIHGRCDFGAAILRADCPATNIDIAAQVTIRAGARAGIVTGLAAEPNSRGIACMLDAEAGEITTGEVYTWALASGPNLSQIIDRVHRPVACDRPYRLRLLHRHRYVELYIDDCLVFSTVTDAPAATGGIACALENATADFRYHSVHALEPLTGG